MSTYQMNEASFDLPAGWRDQSVNIFVVGGPEPPMHLSVVISRDRLKEGLELVDHIEKQLADIGKKLRNFRVLGKRQLEIEGVAALEAELTWVAEQTPMHQRQIYLQSGSRVLIVTATAPIKIADEHNEQLDAMLGTLRFED